MYKVKSCWIGGRQAVCVLEMKCRSKSLQIGALADSWQVNAHALSA